MKTDLDTRDPMSLAIDRAERDAASAAQLSKRARALAGRIRTSQTHDRLPSAPPPQQQGFTIGAALSLDSWTLAQSSAPGLRVATSPSSLLLAESRGFLVLEPAAEARAAALGDYVLHPAGEATSPRGQGGISLLTAGIHKARATLGSPGHIRDTSATRPRHVPQGARQPRARRARAAGRVCKGRPGGGAGRTGGGLFARHLRRHHPAGQAHP